MTNPTIPYKYAVEELLKLTRLPELPTDDITPNLARSVPNEGVLIAFKTPPQYLKWFTSCVETGADILWRDNQDLAQQIKDGFSMATEYPLPIDSLDSLSEIDEAAKNLSLSIINSNLQTIRNAYYGGGQTNTSVFPNAPATMPSVASVELDELCAAVYTFIAYSLDELSDAVADVLEVPRLLTKLGKALGAKGLIASILIKVATELIETITEAAINNQDNLDALSCIMLANLRGRGLSAGNFGRALDVAPLSDPIQEAVRAVLSVNLKQIDAYLAFLDVYRQADSTPFAALPSCPCDVGWSQVFDFTQTSGGFFPLGTSPLATWRAGIGWRSTTGTGGQAGDEFLFIRRDFSATVIRQIQFTYATPTAGGGGTRQMGVAGGSLVTLSQSALDSATTSLNINALVSNVAIILDTNVPSGSAFKNVVTQCVISGDGINPFI